MSQKKSETLGVSEQVTVKKKTKSEALGISEFVIAAMANTTVKYRFIYLFLGLSVL
jgi:hypothetical protein